MPCGTESAELASYKHKGLSLVSIGVESIEGREWGSSQELSQNLPPEALPSYSISLNLGKISEKGFSDGSVMMVCHKP